MGGGDKRGEKEMTKGEEWRQHIICTLYNCHNMHACVHRIKIVVLRLQFILH